MSIPWEKADTLFGILEPDGWVWSSPPQDSTPHTRPTLVSPSGEVEVYFADSPGIELTEVRSVIFEKWVITEDLEDSVVRHNEWGAFAKARDELCNDGGLEAFFDRVGRIVIPYCARRSLRIYKYATSCPRWLLNFLHPAGDSAYIELYRVDRQTLHVSALWRLFDFEHNAIRHYRDDGFALVAPFPNMDKRLDTYLKSVLTWDRSLLRYVDFLVYPQGSLGPSLEERRREHEDWHLRHLAAPTFDEP